MHVCAVYSDAPQWPFKGGAVDVGLGCRFKRQPLPSQDAYMSLVSTVVPCQHGCTCLMVCMYSEWDPPFPSTSALS